MNRNTTKYVIKDGNEIVYYGISDDPVRREQEHRNEGMKFTSFQKVGNVTTRDAAGAWEEERIKHYMSQHGGNRPRYNHNDTGK